jgi:glycosyltransferase involved in cell wall biosynthesis
MMHSAVKVSVEEPTRWATRFVAPQPKTRVLIVTPQPFFEDRGTPIAVSCVARALASAGREVDVLSFPLGRRVDIPGVHLERAGNPWNIRQVPIGFSMGKLLLDASLVTRFRNLLETRNYDVVHAVEEAAWFASVLCPPRGQPFIYDMASAIPEELRGKGILGLRPVRALLEATERRVLGRASQVVCSQGLKARIHSFGIDTPVSEWRFPVPDAVDDNHQTLALRLRLGLAADDRVVLYAGNFSRYQGVDLLVDAFAAAALRDPRLVLVCVGAEDERRAAQMLDRVPEPLRPRVRMVTRIQRGAIPRWLAMADCLVSPRSGGANLPLKVFEYLAAHRPIIATRLGSHESVLGDGRAFLCDAEPGSLAAAMLDVFTDPVRARRMADDATSYARRHYGWAEFSRFINDIYDRVLSGPAGRLGRVAPSGGYMV